MSESSNTAQRNGDIIGYESVKVHPTELGEYNADLHWVLTGYVEDTYSRDRFYHVNVVESHIESVLDRVELAVEADVPADTEVEDVVEVYHRTPKKEPGEEGYEVPNLNIDASVVFSDVTVQLGPGRIVIGVR